MNWNLYALCVAGIAISVLLPVLWAAVRRYFPQAAPAGFHDDAVAWWDVVKPYLVLGVASALTALLLMYALGDEIGDGRAAMLAGYAWDSTLQKLKS